MERVDEVAAGSTKVPSDIAADPHYVQRTVDYLVDGVELVRQAFQLSLGLNTTNDKESEPVSGSFSAKDPCSASNQDEDFTWLLGTSGSAKTVPLLRVIRAEYAEHYDEAGSEVSRRVLVFSFTPFNLAVRGGEPCSWKDRRGNYVALGDIILFAFQLQTGVTTSRHITQLGQLPISLLDRKALAERIKSTSAIPTPQQALPYSPIEKLTRAVLHDPSLPLVAESWAALSQLCPQVAVEQIGTPFTIGGKQYVGVNGVEAAEEKKDDGSAAIIKPHATQSDLLVSGLSFCHRLAQRSQLVSEDNMMLSIFSSGDEAVEILGKNTSLRVDRIDPGNDVVQLYERHARQALRSVKPSSTADASSASRRNTADVRGGFQAKADQHCARSDAPPAAVPPSPSHRRSSQLTLFEYLKSKRAKPIIVVPSYLPQYASSLVLHFKNCQHFFERKQLSSDKLPSSETSNVQDTGFFPWNVTLPWADSSGNKSSNNVTFKVVDTSQVTRFRAMDWYRTVAVVLQGPEWQLSNWPFSSLDALFRCIKPVYFAYEADALPAIVQRFGVEVLRVKRTSRHGDSTAWFQLAESLSRILRQPRIFSLFDAKKLEALA